MRIAVAGFAHETNTFAPMPMRYADFGDWLGGGIPEGEGVFSRTPDKFSLHGFARLARADGHELVPLLHAFGPPASRIEREAYETITGRMVELLAQAGPVDAVFLELHGAMVAEGFDDADAETVRRVRAQVGDTVPIVITLDSHGNVPQSLVELADGIAAYRTYPHVDMLETGERAYRLLAEIRAGRRLAKGFRAIPYLMPIHLQTTMAEPCKSIYARLEQAEAEAGEGTCLSFMTGFSLADVPHCQPCVFGYGLDEARLAAALDTVEHVIAEVEDQFHPDLMAVETAIEQALAVDDDRPVILADVQDNAGGGASSDSIWAISALLKAGARDAVVGLLYDPEAAARAHEAGAGAEITIGLGGKLMPDHSPLVAKWRVERLHEGPFDLKGPMLGGTQADLGKMAQLRCEGVRVVVTSIRTWYVEREHFRAVGIDPENHAVVVVKSTNHYRADFTAIASQIIEFAAPAAVTLDPTHLTYQRLEPDIRLHGMGPTRAQLEAS